MLSMLNVCQVMRYIIIRFLKFYTQRPLEPKKDKKVLQRALRIKFQKPNCTMLISMFKSTKILIFS